MRRTIAAAARLLVPLYALAHASDGAAQSRRAVDLTGRVTDRQGQPVVDATVSIAELTRSANSASDGRFRFAAVPSGRYTISARRLGYLATARQIILGAVPLEVTLTLDEGAIRIEPVNVSATRQPIVGDASPLATSVLTGADVHPEGGVSLAHAVAQLPGVRSVTSGEQIGKPMIRGLFGPRVLMLSDGNRIEDYSWSDEDGPSIDARLADRIEVIRGPASVLYGSDALAGVVNVVPASLPFSADGSRHRREAVEAYFGSNNLELGSAGLVEGAEGRYGYRVMATGRAGQNYATPAGTLQNSSFWAFNGDAALGIRGDRGATTVRASHYGGEFHLLEASGPEAGDPTGGPVRQTLDDRIQVTNDYAIGGSRLETKGQWQRHSLAEVSDDCVPAPGQTSCVKVKDQQAFQLLLNTGTVDVMLHHATGGHLVGTVGVSGMYQSSSTAGPIFLVPGATTTSLGAFAFEQATAGMLSVVAGVRGDSRSLASDASAALGLAADDRSWTAANGDVGLVLRPIDHLSIVANIGTGWRAPTLFDLYTNGPNVADARYEIGDATLTTERAVDADAGVRWTSDRARAEVTVFHNGIRNYIYNAPTAQVISGLQVVRHQQTDATMQGAELAAAIDLAAPLTVRASYDYVRGAQRLSDAPLPLMPAPRTIAGATLHSSRLGWATFASLGAEIEHDATQTRLAPFDIPTSGYTLLNLTAAMERPVRARAMRFDLGVRNATNATYRDFLSRYKGFAFSPGVNVVAKLSIGAI